MPRSDFGPEVKASMQGNPNTPAPARAPKPMKSPGAQVSEQARDSSGNTDTPPKPPGPGRGGMPGMVRGPGQAMPGGGMPPDAHHIAAAAGIAHAILGNRGLR